MSVSQDQSAADGRDDSYRAMPVFRGFANLMDPSLYRPVPDGWLIGVADIVQSTKAIANNRYKAVNMAGAAVIASVTNALEGRDFPFAFGGDGASFAISPQDADAARDALAATATWVKEISICRCALRWCRSRPFARRVSMCVWRAMRRRRTYPMRCSQAADWHGRKLQ